MGKMLLLIAMLGLTSGACAYAYAARTVLECGGLEGAEWGEGTLSRLEEMEFDQRTADAELNSSAYLELESPDDLIWLREAISPYVSRSKARYQEQVAETTPPCLKRIQTLAAEMFYLDWKVYEAVQHGDLDLAAERQDQWLAAGDAVWSEYERLVEKYHWEE